MKMKKIIVFALLLMVAQGAWSRLNFRELDKKPVEGPWKYEEANSHTHSAKIVKNCKYKDMNGGTWWLRWLDDEHRDHEPVDQFHDGDGVGFLQCSESVSGQIFAVFSTYKHEETVPAYTRRQLVWKFRFKGRTSEFPQCQALYAHDNYDELKNTTVDMTCDYSDKSGDQYLLEYFKIKKGEGEESSKDYKKTFQFDNRNGSTEQTITWWLMLTNTIDSKGKYDEAHQWASFKSRGSSWQTFYYKHITFHENADGVTGAMAVQEIENGHTLTPNAFTREGYTFAGWATSEDGPVVYVDQALVTATKNDKGPRELYAVWKTSEQEAADVIKKIGVVEYTPECRARIDLAQQVYDNLTQQQQATVANSCLLPIADHVYAAEGLIEAIGTVEYNEASKEKIDAARAAYAALTEVEKEFVNNYSSLTDAEESYAAFLAADLINTLPEPVEYPASGDAINAAMEAFANLSDKAKAELTVAQLEKLQKAHETYEIMAGKSTIHFVDNTDRTIRKQVVDIVYPDAPQIQGYTFQYWQTNAEDIENGIIRLQAYYTKDDPTDLDETIVNGQSSNRKFIKDGNLYILKEEFIYTINGQRVNK